MIPRLVYTHSDLGGRGRDPYDDGGGRASDLIKYELVSQTRCPESIQDKESPEDVDDE